MQDYILRFVNPDFIIYCLAPLVGGMALVGVLEHLWIALHDRDTRGHWRMPK